MPFIFYCIEVKVASTLPNEKFWSGKQNKTKNLTFSLYIYLTAKLNFLRIFPKLEVFQNFILRDLQKYLHMDEEPNLDSDEGKLIKVPLDSFILHLVAS